MGISVNDIVTGRKTFFILPDTSLIPETYLEDYFALGYECYFVPFDKRINIKKKVKVITSLFKDLIIFFNIDYNLPGLDWDDYIYEYLQEYKNPDSVGIMYAKRQTKAEKSLIERKYLYEMGVRCGCVQLEYQKNHNFDLIARLLYANQAQGRRKRAARSRRRYSLILDCRVANAPRNDEAATSLRAQRSNPFSNTCPPFPFSLQLLPLWNLHKKLSTHFQLMKWKL